MSAFVTVGSWNHLGPGVLVKNTDPRAPPQTAWVKAQRRDVSVSVPTSTSGDSAHTDV